MHESIYNLKPDLHPEWGFDFDLVLLIFADAPHPGDHQRFRMAKMPDRNVWKLRAGDKFNSKI